MSTRATRRSGGSVGHFAVGRRLRHVAQVAPAVVVDAAGCGCRPLALSLPSFLKPSKPAAAASASSTTTSFFPSSSSAASFSSSSSSYNNNKHQQQQGLNNWPPPSSPAPAVARTRQPAPAAKKKKKTRQQQQSQRSSCYYQVEEKKKKAAMAMAMEEEGVAMEKESSDPRGDFRESMTQMVVETGLCGWDDLRCMLRRLLALNSPRHHSAILTAFAELCAQLAAPPPPPPSSSSPPPPPASYHYQYQY